MQVLQDTDGIATLNPFRYRSYYFDVETGLYYLQTRYYDPELGRFISADSIEYLDSETIGGLNLYAYCGNNPVMRADSFGSDWNSFWQGVGNWFVNAGHWINNNIIQPTANFLKDYGDIILTAIVAIGAIAVGILTFGLGTVIIGMAVGAAVGAAFGAMNAAINGENILFGALSGGFIGMLSGIGGNGIIGMLIAGVGAAFGGFSMSLLGDVVNHKEKDYGKALFSGITNGILSFLCNGVGNYLANTIDGIIADIVGNYMPSLFFSVNGFIADTFYRMIRNRRTT